MINKINFVLNFFKKSYILISITFLILILSSLINGMQVNAQDGNGNEDGNGNGDGNGDGIDIDLPIIDYLEEKGWEIDLFPPGLQYNLLRSCDRCSLNIGGSLIINPENDFQIDMMFSLNLLTIFGGSQIFNNNTIFSFSEESLVVPYILEDPDIFNSQISGFLTLGISKYFQPITHLLEFDQDNDGIYNFQSFQDFDRFITSSVDCPEPITGLIFAGGLGGAALKRAKDKSKKINS